MTQDNGQLAVLDPPQNQQVQRPDHRDAPARINPAFGSKGMEIHSFDDCWKLANAIARSPFAPKGVDTPEAIFVAIQLGLEVGMPPMMAMQSIAVINGRPGIYGDAALALVRGSGLCVYFLEFPSNNVIHALAEELSVAMEFDDRDDTQRVRKAIASLTAKLDRSTDDYGYTSISKRQGAVTSVVRRFTISDAKKAALWGKSGPWSQYSDRMLMWRSRGFNLRDNFGDVLKGMYTAEEAQDIPPVLPGPAATAQQSLPLNERVRQARQLAAPAPELSAPSAPPQPPSAEDGPNSPDSATDAAVATQQQVGTGGGGAFDQDTGEVVAEAESNNQPVAPESEVDVWNAFEADLRDTAIGNGHTATTFKNSLKKTLVRMSLVGKAWQMEPEVRKQLAKAVAEGRGDFAR